jgi:hypothetical protein
MTETGKVCPEGGHEFQGNGWDGVDAHWLSLHEDTMPYKHARPLIECGMYLRKQDIGGLPETPRPLLP